MPIQAVIDKLKRKRAQKTSLFLVFDRDGTLVPFHHDPARAILGQEVLDRLDRLAKQKGVLVGILSARGLNHLVKDFPNNKQILAGNYGMEIHISSTINYKHPKAEAVRDLLMQIREELIESLLPQFEAVLEDHELSLCLHWHRTPDLFKPKIHSIVKEICKDKPQLQLRALPSSYEFAPSVDWDKARGLEEMLRLARVRTEDVALVYAGDSPADEAAFAWVNHHEGISIQVGSESSHAQFKLESPAQLHELIHSIEHLDL